MGTSLRQKLFLSTISGIVLLAIILSIITSLAFTRARTQSVGASATALEGQGQTNLELLLQRNVTLVDERFDAAAQTGQNIVESIGIAAAASLINPDYLDSLRLIPLPNGGLSDTRPALMMSLYVPPDADEQAVRRDLAATALLETLLPLQSQAQTFLSTTYIGTSGVARIYPPIDLISADLSRERDLVDRFNTGDTRQVWLAPVKSPKSSGLILTVVTPLYAGDTFSGIIATDVSLDQVTYDIASYLPTAGSSAFLLDDQRRLVAAPPAVLAQLTGRPLPGGVVSQNAVIPLTTTANLDLDRVLTRMAGGEEGVERVEIDGVAHFVSFAPIGITGLRMGLMTPANELTLNSARVAETIGATSAQVLVATIASTVLFGLIFAALSFWLSRRMTRPLTNLAAASHALAEGNYQQVRVESRDEIGAVAAAFNLMSSSVQQAYATLEAQKDQLEENVRARTLELTATVDQLGDSLALQATLNDLLRAMSTPIIPVAHDVLLMPLIGAVDQERAGQALDSLLQHIQAERARFVIVDVTGLAVIDTAVAATLLQCARAARLLGAQTTLVGVRPEVAQTMVALGTDLEDLHFMSNLEAAIAQVFTQPGRKSRR